MVVFSSGRRTQGAILNLEGIDLTVTRPDMAGLWFGNSIATAYLTNADIKTASNGLVIANRSTVAQELDRFVGEEDTSTKQHV